MKWYSDSTKRPETISSVNRALIITVSGNILLAVVKSLAAEFIGSSALRADALNSCSDVLYSITLVVGMLIASRPADLSHPQGHERFEPLTGLMVSLSMAVAGHSAFREAIHKIIAGPQALPLGISGLVLLVSAAVKYVMYRKVGEIAISTDNIGLNAAAKDNLMDVLTSAAAFLGILTSGTISPYADPIAGIAVSLWIFRSAYLLLCENLGYLTGKGLAKPELEECKEIIRSVPGILDVHRLFGEYVGPNLVLDIHVNVDGNKTLNEVHGIETNAEKLLLEKYPSSRIYIHSEPPDED